MENNITLRLNGSFARADTTVAGVQGEANAKTLIVLLQGRGWRACSSVQLYFDDADGAQAAVIQLVNTDPSMGGTLYAEHEHHVKLPAEAMVSPGQLRITARGYDANNNAVRKAAVKLEVLENHSAYPNPTDPTPTLAEQLTATIQSVADSVRGWAAKLFQPPAKINSGNNNWMVWNPNTEEYEDSGFSAVHIVDASGGLVANGITSSYLADGAIIAAKLADGAVTAGKLADGAVTHTKLGADAVGTNNVQAAAITADELSDGAVTHTKLGVGAVSTNGLADSAVTENKLGAGAVTNGKLADGSVTAGKLADKAVTNAKLADSCVSTGKLTDKAVSTDKLADSSVTAAKLGVGAVTTAKLADRNVTGDKLAAGAVGNYALGTRAVSLEKLDDDLRGRVNDFIAQSGTVQTNVGYIRYRLWNSGYFTADYYCVHGTSGSAHYQDYFWQSDAEFVEGALPFAPKEYEITGTASRGLWVNAPTFLGAKLKYWLCAPFDLAVVNAVVVYLHVTGKA